MTETEADKKAGELCKRTGCDCGGTGAIARVVTSAEVPVEDVECDACELHAHFTAALAAAREDGRREEREACWRLAERCRAEREASMGSCFEAGGSLGSLLGKLSEAERIRDLISARGPMGEP